MTETLSLSLSHLSSNWASLVAQTVKRLSAMWETWVLSLGQEDPLEKGKATHSSILAWRILWKRNLAGYSPWGSKELDIIERISLLLSKTLPSE